MKTFPILCWPHKTTDDDDYQLVRKTISAATGVMPSILSGNIDLAAVLNQHPQATVYFPVFCESTGWWGELLGGNAIVTDKIIISPECQLMVIQTKKTIQKHKTGQNQLFAAEIYPTSGFFKKMDSQIATVTDMLATDAGTILALFSGENRSKFMEILEATGNSYLGCIGNY